MARRGRWLQTPGVLEAMGISPLEEDLVELRDAVVAHLAEQMKA